MYIIRKNVKKNHFYVELNAKKIEIFVKTIKCHTNKAKKP